MSLTTGSRIGSYEVLGVLGAGGMGEVYRGRDTKLNRDVAIKVLLNVLDGAADRARFEREAQVLASLNHPRIAHLYGFEEGPPAFLVMELVEGPTLAEQITASALPLEDVRSIGGQIAEALEAAHDAGIIHRDLKPANVKVKADGSVKVLDFGLAKATVPEGATANAMNSPTLSNHATQLGMILGTAAYMSPEQAKGRPVDKRADIWAFGVVLYEMLTGRQLFHGDSVAETIGFVATRDPDWTALPDSTPATMRRLLHRCLVRDPKLRLRDIGEARIALADAGAAIDALPQFPSVPPRPSSRSPLVAAALAVTAIAGGIGWYSGSSTIASGADVTPFRSEIIPTPSNAFENRSTAPIFTFTPDGNALIYASSDPAARTLYRRGRDASAAVPIAGTDGAYGPFVSHDGASIGFFADGAMKRVPLGGGTARVIHNMRSATAPDAVGDGWTTELGPGREVGIGATWLPDDTIVYGRIRGALWRVSAEGGTPTPVTKIEAGEIGHRLPSALPGGRVVLCTIIRDFIANADSSVEAVDLISGRRTLVIQNATDGRYVGTGRLLFARRGALYSVGFDPATLKVSGEPAPISDDVMHAIGGGQPARASGTAQYAVSADGMLALIGGGTNTGASRMLVWVSRGGSTVPVSTEATGFLGARLSLDETRIAVRKAPFVAILNARDGISTPLLQGALFPVWSFDEARIYVARRSENFHQPIYGVPLSGGEPELIVDSEEPLWPSHVSKDGRFLAYVVSSSSVTGTDIWVKSLSPGTTPMPLVATRATEGYPMFSPDGKWLAYAVENTDGDADGVYVRPFPGPGRAERVSGRGSIAPVWARNGASLYYGRLTDDGNHIGEIVRVAMDASGDRMRIGQPVTFATGRFNKSVPVSGFDVTADEKRILAIMDAPPPGGAAAPTAIRTLQLIFLRR